MQRCRHPPAAAIGWKMPVPSQAQGDHTAVRFLRPLNNKAVNVNQLLPDFGRAKSAPVQLSDSGEPNQRSAALVAVGFVRQAGRRHRQLVGRRAQRLGNPAEHRNRQVPLAAFDLADIRPVDVRLVRQLLGDRPAALRMVRTFCATTPIRLLSPPSLFMARADWERRSCSFRQCAVPLSMGGVVADTRQILLWNAESICGQRCRVGNIGQTCNGEGGK